MKVAVVGAGAVGAAAARALCRSGNNVTVFEQFEPGHASGSSHGTSRIIRRAYEDPLYANLMDEVFPMWKELEEECGENLYFETGVLVFGTPESDYLRRTRETLLSLKLPYEAMGYLDVAKRFGGFHLDPDEEALFQPDAGYLRADQCIAAALESARSMGAAFRFQTRADVADGLVNGEAFDAIVLCVGQWTGRIAGRSDLVPRLQRFAYFDAPMEPSIPVWIDGSDDHFYGFPGYGRGFKVGRHKYGPVIDPESPRPTDEESLDAIRREARKRLGADTMLEAFDCVYTVTENEDFRIGRLPGHVPMFWASPCSGHGFKFSIWFGQLLADLVHGKRSVEDFPRFCA